MTPAKLTIKKIISNLFSSHTSVCRLNIRYIRTEYFDQYAINTSYYIMFNRFECAYYSVKHFIMFVNDFTVKCYWIIWIHDVASQWKLAALLFVNENWRSWTIFFPAVKYRSVCLKTLELIRGFGLRKIHSSFKMCNVILQLKPLLLFA